MPIRIPYTESFSLSGEYSISQAGNFGKNNADIFQKIRAPAIKGRPQSMYPLIDCAIIPLYGEIRVHLCQCNPHRVFRIIAQLKYSINFMKRQ